MPPPLRRNALLLAIVLALSSCSGIFGPEDILQEFEIEQVNLESSISEPPTADVRGGTEQVTVDGWVVQSGSSAPPRRNRGHDSDSPSSELRTSWVDTSRHRKDPVVTHGEVSTR